MKIDVARMQDAGCRLEGVESAKDLGFDGSEVFQFLEGVRYVLSAYVVADQLFVSGTLEAEVTAPCARCTETTGLRLLEPGFERHYEVSEEIESVDLTLDIREAIILAFPNYPVCRGDCRGLCSQCGKNLNEGTCVCRPPEDPRWAGLTDLGKGK